MGLLEKTFVLITDDPTVESSMKNTIVGSNFTLVIIPHFEAFQVEQICSVQSPTTILVHTSGKEEGHLVKLMEFRKKMTMDNVEIVFFSEVRTALEIVKLK